MSHELNTAPGTSTAPPQRPVPVPETLEIPDGAAAFTTMRRAFADACSAAADQRAEKSLALGGGPATLRTVGARLGASMGRPLSHLAAPAAGGPPRLTIELWDEGETRVPCPGCAINEELGIDGILTHSADGRYLGYQRARSMTLYDRRAGHLVGWSNYGDGASMYELGRPLHVPLSLWFCDIGMQMMHSGLVARDGVGVLFPGMGGSGKSTTSLTCLHAGFDYLGDDYIALSVEDGAYVGHSLYCSSHLEPHHLRRFPHLRPHAVPATSELEDKWLILLDEVCAGQFLPSAQIRAIALPTVVDAEVSRLAPCSKAEALLALAPSSIVMIPGRGAAGMDRLGDLVASVPCYRLELGRKLSTIADLVDDIIAEAV